MSYRKKLAPILRAEEQLRKRERDLAKHVSMTVDEMWTWFAGESEDESRTILGIHLRWLRDGFERNRKRRAELEAGRK